MTLTVVGLGPGDPGQITRAGWDALANARQVHLRTRLHPCVPDLPAGPTYHSFDHLYQQADHFGQVYERIVERLLALLEASDEVVYAVPGDPLVGEASVTRLLAACRERGIEARVVSGVSFIEPVLAALDLDALTGLQLLDATEVAAAHHPPINPDLPALIAQVYGRHLASDLKLTLMNQYPDEHPVRLVHAAGTDQQRIEDMALYQLDRSPATAHLTTLYVPPLKPAPGAVTGFEGFQNTVARLRAPDGCPWDRQQNHLSLRRHLLEETYEVLAALDAEDADLLREELGDLLLQVVLHSQIAVDEGEFRMGDVIAMIDAKLKHRHPHVWGDVDVHGDPQRVLVNWEHLKAEERADQGQAERSLLDGVPKTLPALAQAHAYDTRAVRVGFDWPDQAGVLAKVHEEIEEVRAAQTPQEIAHEIGDLLLAIAVWARWLGVHPEDALRQANARFYRRFTYIERRAREQGRSLAEMSVDEMNALWDDAKHQDGEG
jgi:tetrapyrrole methylase family protein/MazG family protein